MGFRGSRVQIPPSRLSEDEASRCVAVWGFFLHYYDPLYVHHGVLRTMSAARRERAALGYDGHTRRGTMHHRRSRLRFDAVFRMSD